MANKKLFPYEITSDYLNKILGLSTINVIYGGKVTKQFKKLVDDSTLPLDTQEEILDTANTILKESKGSDKTTEEINNQVKNATINIANDDTIDDIKRKYGDYKARWLPSDSANPSVTHEQFYFKIFKVSKGLYDKSYGAYVIPGERPNCKCGMELLDDSN